MRIQHSLSHTKWECKYHILDVRSFWKRKNRLGRWLHKTRVCWPNNTSVLFRGDSKSGFVPSEAVASSKTVNNPGRAQPHANNCTRFWSLRQGCLRKSSVERVGEKVRLHPGQAQLPGRWGNRVGILGVALKCLEGLSEGMLGADLFLVQCIPLLASSSRGAGQPVLAEMRASH